MTRLNRGAELGSWGFFGLEAHGASAAKPGRRHGARRGGEATGKSSAVRRAALAALEMLEDRTLMSTVATGLPHWLEQGPGPIENGQTAGLLPIGPDGLLNPVAGAASAVALVPGDPNTIYLGTINGGIWKTTNADTQMVGGMPTWQPLTDQNPSLSIGALALDPSDASHQTLWAGMAHRSSFQNRGGPLTGVVRSADGGATWNAIDPATFADTNVFNIVPLPATASGQTVLVATSDGLFRRTDPSQSFSKVSGPLPNGPVSQLVQAPGNPNRLYVSFPLNGVFTSPDGGANWFNASGDLPTARTKDANRIRLAIHSNAGSPDSDVVYTAFVNKEGDLVGVSRSADHGAHWSDLGRPITTETKFGGGGTVQFTITPGKQGQTHLSLVADPDDPNTVFIGGDRQPLTRNDGIEDGANSLGANVSAGNLFRFGPDNANKLAWEPVTFSGANGTAPHADSRDMVFNSNGDIVELDDGGVYKLSRPNAAITRHWVPMDGNLANAELLSIAYDPTNGGVIAGAQDIGTGYEGPSATFPDKWYQAMGGDGVRVRVSPMDTDNDGHPDQTIRYFAAQELNVSRVTVGANGQAIVPAAAPAFEVNGSGGKTIHDVENAIPAPAGKSTGSTIAFNTRFQPNAVSPKRLLIGTNYLYESTDAGDHVDALAGLTPVGSAFRPDAAGDLGRITAIVYGGRLNGADAPDVAWIGAIGKGDGQVLLRTSAGNTFQAVASYSGSIPIDITVDPENWQHCFVLDLEGNVFRTVDGGGSWEKITGNLGDLTDTTHTIQFVPGSDAAHEALLLGGRNVYRLINPTGAATPVWGGFGADLPNTDVMEIRHDANDHVIVAATLGRGAWKIDDASVATPTTLEVVALNDNDKVDITRDATRPGLLQVIVNGTVESSVPLATVGAINITGSATSTATIDQVNGLIDTPVNYTRGGVAATADKINEPPLAAPGKGLAKAFSSFSTWLAKVFHTSTAEQRFLGTKESIGGAFNEGDDFEQALEDPVGGVINPGDEALEAVDGDPDGGGQDTLQNALDRILGDRIRAYLAADTTPTVAEFVKSLGSIDTQFGDMTLRVDPASVTASQSASAVTFGLDLKVSVTREVPLDLDGVVGGPGLHVDADLDFDASLDLKFSFGYDLTPGKAPEEAFFIHPESLSVTAGVNASGLDADLDLGFLKAQVQNGTFQLNAGLSAAFKGPGNITGSQLEADDGETFLSFTPTGSIHANLPITTSLAGLNGSAKVTIDDANLFDATPPTVTTPNLQDLLDFQNLTPQTVLGALGNVATFLKSFRGSPVFAAQIPFTGGHTLGDALDVSKSFLDHVNGHLKDADGNPTFDDAVSLSEALADAFGLDASVINVHYDPATHSLLYHLNYDADSSASFPLALGAKVGALASIQASGNLGASAHATAGFDVGVHLPDVLGGAPADAFFLSNGQLDGSVNFSLSGASASAVFGPIAIHAGNASASGQANANLQLASGKQVTFHQLFDALAKPADLANLVSANIGGDAHLALGNISVDTGLFTLSGNPQLNIDVPDIIHPAPQLSYNDAFNPLKQFENFDFNTVTGALHSVLDFLKSLANQPFMKQKLPFANRSLADLLSFADKFATFIDKLESDPAQTLQALSGRINKALSDALGIPQQNFVTLAIDGDALKVTLDFSTGFHATVPIDVDLASLAGGASGIGSIANLTGSGTLAANVDAGLKVDLGIDLSNPASPRPFVYGDTGLGIDNASLSGNNLDFSATVGPLGVFVKNGHASLGPIDFDIRAGAPDSRFFLDAGLPNFSPTLTGGASIDLPLFFPDSSTPIGNPNDLKITIGSIADISNTTQVTAPDLSGIANSLDLTSNLGALVDGVDRLLGWLHDALNSGLFGKELPIVGKHINTADAAEFIQKFRTEILAKFKGPNGTSSAAAVKNELFQVLNDSLHILGDRNNDNQVTPDDIEVVQAADDVHFNLKLSKHVTLAANDPAHPIGFDLGVSGLGLSVNTNVEVGADFDLNLGFGVSRTQGFYFVDAGPDLFHVGLQLSTPNLNAEGQLAFLNLTATDDAAHPTHFGGALDVSLKDPNHDGKITLSEISADPIGLIDATISGDAHVGMHLLLNVGAPGSPTALSFPSLESDFALDWHFGASSLAGQVFGDKPLIQFNHVKLNFGEFLTKFAGPILHDIQQVLKPIEPIVDVLTARIPVISDLAGHDVTLIDLAKVFAGDEVDVEFIEVVAKVVKLVESIPQLQPGQQLFIDFGNFTINDDLRTTKATDVNVPDTGDLTNAQLSTQLGGGESASFVAGFDTAPGHGLEFPLLKNPASAFKLLLGQDVSLFTFDLPTLKFGFGFSQFFTIFGPLGVQLSGDVGVTIHAAFGYDTKGLSEFAHDVKTPGQNTPGQLATDLLDGFFISTRTNPDGTGDPAPVVTLHAGIEAFASINLGVVAAGVGGGIFADVSLSLHDPNDDGKLRLAEIGSILENSPLCLFEADGELTAGLSAFVRFLVFTKHFDIAQITLLSFHHECEDNPPPAPVLATRMPDGTLLLNMGPRAAQRVTHDVTDGDENFTVTHVSGTAGDETVSVTAFGYTQQFDHVNSVQGHGGQGNDTILLQGVLAPATLSGDAGNDTLVATAGIASFDGGAGDDALTGGSQADVITGGAGNDIIDGADGNDSLDGGDGDNQVRGGAGNDTITVSGDGSNDLDGGDGNDTITGADGPDVIIGRGGDDTINSGAGADVIQSDEGNDSVDAGAGDDTVEAGAGNDTVHGGAGNDDVDAGEGDDSVFAEAGNDHVEGGAGADHVEAADGDDDVGAGEGNDFVDGGTGADQIEGEEDDDVLHGGEGNDAIDGGEGKDTLAGGDGRDAVSGGEDDDVIDGDAGDDTLSGEDGNDLVRGGAGNDLLRGGAGDDTMDGQLGDDTLVGADGNDSLAGGEGNDMAFGDNGNDTIAGNAGDDELHGGVGDDHLSGDAGNDLVLGEAGIDVADGGADNDTVFGNAGNDLVTGSSGDDVLSGGQGDDVVDGGDGNDAMFGDDGYLNPGGSPNRGDSATDGRDLMTGGSGDDRMFGQGGDDDVLGQAGNDTISGDAGDDDLVGGSAVAGAADGDDVIDGGLGNDVIAGDNALVVRRGDTLSPFVRTPAGTLMYNPFNPADALVDGAAAVTAGPRANPRGVAGRDVTLYDHSDNAAATAGKFGNDNIAGGGGDDLIFGQLGDDTLQGDSSAAEAVSPADPSADAATDGHDHVEGNGGGDLIFGNGGQDDLIGGSSSLFGLSTAALRPDGSDTIFGGSGLRASINHAGDASATGHAADADFIVGDNGNVYRLVNASATAFLQFNYDNYSNGLPAAQQVKIIPRAVDLLDYSADGNAANDVGGADVIHGEAGDDSVHGASGDDKLYGDGQDDDLYGEGGNDWVSGGAGDDGVLGDDGKLSTSRNGTAEPLYGVAATAQQSVSTNGGIYQAVVDPTGQLKKAADLEPFGVGGNDTVYGGLGNDSVHGGAGTDALSGAEALQAFYDNPAATPVLTFNNATGRFDLLDLNAPMAKVSGHPLNFLAFNGSVPIDDGRDALFGDDGADWLVGGTNADHLWGGTGNDVLNADDNLDTSGGANTAEDTGSLFGGTDIAYGGGGRDALIGNSKNDRLVDWVGEFNNYNVPFSQFGNSAVARQILPGLVDFLLKLSRGDGADQTRVGAGLGTAARNGEPFGELGMFLQSDAGWNDQTGGPVGPQPQ